MTYREYMETVNPYACYEDGYVLGCPGNHFRGAPLVGPGSGCGLKEEDCITCWGREIPAEMLAPKIEEVVRDDEDNA